MSFIGIDLGTTFIKGAVLNLENARTASRAANALSVPT